MDIKTSLVIVEKYPNAICMIKSGNFVRFYNQSYYLATEVLGIKLKPRAGYIKSANNRFVVHGGMPLKSVKERFPNAEKTVFGFGLRGTFDLSGYPSWLSQREAEVASGEALASLPATAEPLYLTAQQSAFLSTWQRGVYPLEVEYGFLDSLQNAFLKDNP